MKNIDDYIKSNVHIDDIFIFDECIEINIALNGEHNNKEERNNLVVEDITKENVHFWNLSKARAMTMDKYSVYCYIKRNKLKKVLD